MAEGLVVVPEFQRYVVRTETRVVVESALLSGGVMPVGEFIVRSKHEGHGGGSSPQDIPGLVDITMTKNSKAARAMAAGVVNTEGNRLK